MRSHERRADAVEFAEMCSQVYVFGDILQGLFFRHHGNQSGIAAFTGAVGCNQHFHKAVYGKQQLMIKIQCHINGAHLVQPRPDSLADDLGDPLVVPAPRASQVPFRMVSKKIFQCRVL